MERAKRYTGIKGLTLFIANEVISGIVISGKMSLMARWYIP
ncbi:hypothetical protein CHK_0610 [Christensenella hongkongensis]|uniref:Uncharacterized protein n=1 Tax=Christensenella hongkongensis TaxID=270498 RepID=A0A0M2NNC4_9FIRM|nr:hypothetical protein CHK_0610 [Christensenella hongkongensis]